MIILYMMVKNEALTLPRTLATIPSTIKECVFYDTGSTDNTIQVITEWGANTQHNIHIQTGKFIDYSTSRNYGLKYAESFCGPNDYIMVLDANDELVITANVNFAFPDNINAVAVNSEWILADGSIMSHIKFILIRPNKGVKYKGRVHELLCNGDIPFNSLTFINNISIRQHRINDDKKTTARYTSDVQMLQQDFNEDIMPERSAFYLGKTYMLMNSLNSAIEWFKKRIHLKGDQQEVAMSHLLLGRCMMACMRPSTNYNDSQFNKSLMSKIKKNFLASYNTNSDIEPLVWLLECYVQQKKWSKGLIYTKFICLATPPQYNSMHMSNIYTFRRWFLSALIYFNVELYAEGSSALQQARPHNKEEVAQLNEVFNLYVTKAITPVNPLQVRPSIYMNSQQTDERIILIACGFYYGKWDGHLLTSSKGVGGSELVAIKNAEYLAKYYKVYFCCDCTEDVIVNGVHYFPLYKYDAFIDTHIIHTLYVYRNANMIRYNNIKNIYLSLEDVTLFGVLRLMKNFRKVIMKTPWQMTIEPNTTIPREFVKFIGNGIDPQRFLVPVKKNPYKIIYTSCPERGLLPLLDLFPRLQEFMPAELYVYIDTSDAKRYSKINITEVVNRMSAMPGVHLRPRISQVELAAECMSSTYWIYPTVFHETYCISAHEMMAARVLCIYHAIGALPEVIGDKGIAIPSLDADLYVNAVKQHVMGNLNVDTMLDKAQEWALHNTWDTVNEEIKVMIDEGL